MSLIKNRASRLVGLGVPNWAASVVGVVMIVLYLRRAECAGPDPDAAYIAVAWGVILGVSVSTAVHKACQRCRGRGEPRNLSGRR